MKSASNLFSTGVGTSKAIRRRRKLLRGAMSGNMDYGEAWTVSALSELSNCHALVFVVSAKFFTMKNHPRRSLDAVRVDGDASRNSICRRAFSSLSKPKVQLAKSQWEFFAKVATHSHRAPRPTLVCDDDFVIGHDVENFTRHFLRRVDNANPQRRWRC